MFFTLNRSVTVLASIATVVVLTAVTWLPVECWWCHCDRPVSY